MQSSTAMKVAPDTAKVRQNPGRTPNEPLGLSHYRDAIDLIATQRARALRIALFATMLHRPDPDTTTDDTQLLKDIDIQLSDMQKSLNLLTGGNTFDQVPVELHQWLQEEAKAHASHVSVIKQQIRDAQALRRSAERKDPNTGKLIDAFIAKGRGPFFQAVTHIMDALWLSFEEMRHSELKRAEQAINAVTKTLSRLGHIGKHVRLVSLNASVEAARVGDAARGLSVIAQEFKALSDEIQQLAVSAQEDVDTLR